MATAIVACSSAGASPSKPAGFGAQMAWREGEPTPDGCAVASADDVSAASGFHIIKTMALLNNEPGCLYFDADGQVLATRFHIRESGERHFAIEKARPDVVDVPGIGDQAIWIERVWNLWAWEGDTLVMVGIGQIGDTLARFELARKLSALIVSRFKP